MTLLFMMCRERKISQRALAEELGCSKTALWAWNAGRAFPVPVFARKLEQIFGLPAEQLLRPIEVRYEHKESHDGESPAA